MNNLYRIDVFYNLDLFKDNQLNLVPRYKKSILEAEEIRKTLVSDLKQKKGVSNIKSRITHYELKEIVYND